VFREGHDLWMTPHDPVRYISDPLNRKLRGGQAVENKLEREDSR